MFKFPSIYNLKKNEPITFTLMHVAIALNILMLIYIVYTHGPVVENTDTVSYITAWDENYYNGQIDTFRTPVYPSLIGLFATIMGKNWMVGLIMFQIAIFYIAGFSLTRLVFALFKSNIGAWIAVFAYFLFYPILKFLFVIGTEAIAFSLVVLWTEAVWRFMQRPRWWLGVAITLLTLTEIMLRPSMLVLVVALGLFIVAGLFFRQYRKAMLWLIVTLMPVGIVCTLYVNKIEKETGVRTISIVTIFNKYYLSREYNHIFPDLMKDYPEALELQFKYQKSGDVFSQENIDRQWIEVGTISGDSLMTLKQIDDYANAVRELHPDIYYGNIRNNVINSLTHEGKYKNAANMLIVLIYGLLFLIVWLKYKQFPLTDFLWLLVAGGSLLSVILFAQNDYGRLMLPTSPILIFMASQILNCFTLKPFSFTLRNLLPKSDYVE